ncbi:major facilitator superfamily transporter [Purpureocillium lavendulum]|uniref:Major facilitator superfamily transporter n=1 Tax=Purpureocillium lavendulum TaxID=1247861 RepID=A0AB34FZA5_9HYPO|nr:major facilitator superfamily transporter [Purpureocillium lavendulum]
MLLFYYDHNVSSIAAQSRRFPLRKPGGFHWDFFLLGCTTLVAAVLGLPMPNGLVPQAPVHTDSLTVYETELKVITTSASHPPEIRRPIISARAVVEQRVSHFLMGLALVGTMTGPLLTVLHAMPLATFAGVFFVVGWGPIESNGILSKLMFLLAENRFIQRDEPLLQVRRRKIVLYIGLQILAVSACVDAVWNISIDDLRHWKDPDDQEDPNDVLPGDELDGASRTPADVARLQHEKDQRKLWRHAYKSTAGLQTSDLIYGNTLQSLDFKETQSGMHSEKLGTEAKAPMSFATERPFSYNPYPRYNGVEWDLLVFKGRPTKWPSPKFGSYDLLGMDPNICWERETRLGPYKKPRWSGLTNSLKWGALQRQCLMLNSQRFDLTKLHRNERPTTYSEAANLAGKPPQPKDKDEERVAKKTKTDGDAAGAPTWSKSPLDIKSRNSTTEKQTAILLRSYTGMQYTENDRRVIRALVSELSLRTGGEYMVFLLIHSKDKSLRISDDSKLYQKVLRDNVPAEFRDMAILWSDEEISRLYPELKDEDAKSVHYGQWLCVQKFSNDHPQFDFIWNWEMDFRFTGHHYDLLSNLDAFARKQPRKYLWERNERWYIPSYHGDYDTAFRTEVARTHGNDTVWGPPKLPFISPVGPQPPVESPSEDDYIWGIGEDADLITVGPIFDPKNSQWIMSNDIWGQYPFSTGSRLSTPLIPFIWIGIGPAKC